jgi:hypothetical protein
MSQPVIAVFRGRHQLPQHNAMYEAMLSVVLHAEPTSKIWNTPVESDGSFGGRDK